MLHFGRHFAFFLALLFRLDVGNGAFRAAIFRRSQSSNRRRGASHYSTQFQPSRATTSNGARSGIRFPRGSGRLMRLVGSFLRQRFHELRTRSFLLDPSSIQRLDDLYYPDWSHVILECYRICQLRRFVVEIPVRQRRFVVGVQASEEFRVCLFEIVDRFRISVVVRRRFALLPECGRFEADFRRCLFSPRIRHFRVYFGPAGGQTEDLCRFFVRF